MKHMIATLLTALSVAPVAYAAQGCPVSIDKVNAHAFPVTAGLLGADSDPWDSYLQIEYTNIGMQNIAAAKFSVEFTDSLGDSRPSVYSYTSDQTVKTGKKAKPYWGDGVYFHQIGWGIKAIAYLEKIRFVDGGMWVDDGSRSCTSNGISFPTPDARAQSQKPYAPHMDMSDLTIATNPVGAKIAIDGDFVGVSPITLKLIKHLSARVLTITAPGYKTATRELLPDGKPISIAVDLQKEEAASTH